MAANAIAGSNALCVLGMSRTGTSLTTRVLSLAGVYLGPEDELLQSDVRQLAGEGEAVAARARAANPQGFWEHYRIMRLNERILRAFGGSWREPPELPDGWERSQRLASARAEARALLSESFAGHELWGWKDPRNALTVPFWRQLTPALSYVVCLRNPLDVAASLERRDGMTFEAALGLWLAYVAAALVNTSGQRRILVPYDDYFEDPAGAAARIAGFAGRPGAFEDAAGAARLGAAIDERLWRHRTPREELLRDQRVPAEIAGLHLATELRAAAGATEELDPALDAFARRLLRRRPAGDRSSAA